MEKNDAHISRGAVVKKASPSKKNFSKKKAFRLICTDKTY